MTPFNAYTYHNWRLEALISDFYPKDIEVSHTIDGGLYITVAVVDGQMHRFVTTLGENK